MKTPNFFIIGAAKTGTTSLWMYLKQHPDIFMPESIVDKEPSYFCNIYGHNNYDRYLDLFKDADNCKAIGEASTPYLTSPESASWISRVLPTAKIIVVLRNPIDRTYSLYRWMTNNGYEWVYPFEKALEIESLRKNDSSFFRNNPQYFFNYLYYESGLYFEQLSRYYRAFPKNQIKVILLDDLNQKPVETIQSIYAFLGVNDNFVPEIKIYNKAHFRPTFIRAHFKLRILQYRNKNRYIRKIIKYLFETNMTLTRSYWPAMRENTRQMLMFKYKKDIINTQYLIEQDLSSWLMK